MANKISKIWKRVISLLFHLIVLVGFVMLYDSGKMVFDKLNLGEMLSLGGDKDNEEEKEKAAAEPEKGTSMADLMAQKQKKEAKAASQDK